MSNGDVSHLQYKMLLYSLDGRLLSVFCAYEWSLGIKSVAWSPSSQFLAVGSYDGKVGAEQHTWGHSSWQTTWPHARGLPQVRVLNHVTWKAITEFEHPTNINNPKIVSPACVFLFEPYLGKGGGQNLFSPFIFCDTGTQATINSCYC